MNLPMNIIIGNAISLIAGIFILLSMWVNDEKEAYKHQFLNAFILMISSVFFLSWTGVVTMAIAASRNAFVYKDKFTFNWAIFFVIVSVVVGFAVNTMGIVGILPIIALVQLTLCNYYLKTIKPIKISFIVNSAIYVVYFLAIWDFSSAAIEGITVTVGLISLFKLMYSE
ncbi:YgjV family protein [uncultured Methanobrevibacter sp.]|uniref:YgjV family protein n=1 Tax=uncultured Methanobrevibacter sp. TaxID=253161 RepID=UPI0025EEA45A|nr:YgjV family protein [uncultured Methanobrevibacter sp.]MCI6994397.1 YgjV family protein [Methanobrevibacter sp.]